MCEKSSRKLSFFLLSSLLLFSVSSFSFAEDKVPQNLALLRILNDLQNGVDQSRQGLNDLNQGLQEIKDGQTESKQGLIEVKQGLIESKAGVAEAKQEVSELKTDLEAQKQDVRKLKLDSVQLTRLLVDSVSTSRKMEAELNTWRIVGVSSAVVAILVATYEFFKGGTHG